MKTAFLSLLLLFIAGIIPAQTVESVIVEYDVDHYGEKHKQVLFVKDHGNLKVIDVHNPNNTTKRYLSKDGTDHTFMLERNDLNFKYPSVKNDMIYHVYDMNTLTEGKYYLSVKKTGSAKILGKTCDVYAVDTADKQTQTFYMWKGILLKKEAKSSYLIALKITEDPEFEDGQFEIPEGYEFR
jgi:hypothetical protein